MEERGGGRGSPNGMLPPVRMDAPSGSPSQPLPDPNRMLESLNYRPRTVSWSSADLRASLSVASGAPAGPQRHLDAGPGADSDAEVAEKERRMTAHVPQRSDIAVTSWTPSVPRRRDVADGAAPNSAPLPILQRPRSPLAQMIQRRRDSGLLPPVAVAESLSP